MKQFGYDNISDSDYIRNLISKEVELHHHQQQQQQPELSFFKHQLNHHYHHHHQQQHHMMQSSMSSSSIPMNHFMGEGNSNNNNDENSSSTTTGAYDIGDIDQALFHYLVAQNDHDSLHYNLPSSSPPADDEYDGKRPPTLSIFPSQPMHAKPPSPCKGTSRVGEVHIQPITSGPKRASERPSATELPNDNFNKRNKNQIIAPVKQSIKSTKTLRRLAQNREAAKKSRLRKKAYVHQLESSRIRLAQLEQELQRGQAQGTYYGGDNGSSDGDQGIRVGVTKISPDAAVFDTEYTRWLEEHHRLSCELRAALQQEVPENDLKLYVDKCLAHYDVVMTLKSVVAKADVFHLVSGSWKTPAERCFIWLGGFRPSELIKMVMHQVEPLAEDQLINICGLQQTTHEAEEALSQGLQVMHQNLSDVISSDALTGPPNVNTYLGLMALAMNRLSTMEDFVRQADSMRHQTLYQLRHILTTRQAARCFLAIAEYSRRLRALSCLWMSTPRQDRISLL